MKFVKEDVDVVGGGFECIPASKNIWVITDVVKRSGIGQESGKPYLFYDFMLTLDESLDGKAEEFVGKTAKFSMGLGSDPQIARFNRHVNCWGVMDNLVKKLGGDEADPESDMFAGALKLACLDVKVMATHEVVERKGLKNCDNFKFEKLGGKSGGAAQASSDFD